MSLKGNAQSLGKTTVKFGPSYKKNTPERGTAFISWILQDKQAQAMNITKKEGKEHFGACTNKTNFLLLSVSVVKMIAGTVHFFPPTELRSSYI